MAEEGRTDICVQLYRVDLLSQLIDELTRSLFDAAVPHSGKYLGWEWTVMA